MNVRLNADKAALLAIFNSIHKKVSDAGMELHLTQEGVQAGAKRISIAAAWMNGTSAEIGVIDKAGAVHPLAGIGEDGFVVPIGTYSKVLMGVMLGKLGERVASTTPCTGEGHMRHNSTIGGPSNVF